MGLFDTAVDQTDFGWASHIGPEDGRRRVPIGPGAHGDVLRRVGGVGVMALQRRPVPHGLGAVADGGGAVGETRVGVHRRLVVFCQNFQFVVEEYGVFPEGGLRRVVNVGEQAAVNGLACHRVVPGGPCRLHDNGPEQAVDVGAVLAAAGIRHIGEQENAFLIRLPGVADAMAGGGVGVEAHVGTVGGQHVVGKARTWMDARRSSLLSKLI